MIKRDFLIIVDMQTGFKTAYNKRAIKNSIRLFKFALNHRVIPVIMSYMEYGPLVQPLRSVVDKARISHRIWDVEKNRDNGAIWFNEKLQQTIYTADKIYVCGVNLDCCVIETATGLRKYCSKVIICPDACNCNRYEGPNSKIAQRFEQNWAGDSELNLQPIKKIISGV